MENINDIFVDETIDNDTNINHNVHINEISNVEDDDIEHVFDSMLIIIIL